MQGVDHKPDSRHNFRWVTRVYQELSSSDPISQIARGSIPGQGFRNNFRPGTFAKMIKALDPTPDQFHSRSIAVHKGGLLFVYNLFYDLCLGCSICILSHQNRRRRPCRWTRRRPFLLPYYTNILSSLPRTENMCDGCVIILSILVIGLEPGRHMMLYSFVCWIFLCMVDAINNVRVSRLTLSAVQHLAPLAWVDSYDLFRGLSS